MHQLCPVYGVLRSSLPRRGAAFPRRFRPRQRAVLPGSCAMDSRGPNGTLGVVQVAHLHAVRGDHVCADAARISVAIAGARVAVDLALEAVAPGGAGPLQQRRDDSLVGDALGVAASPAQGLAPR
eukprot:3707607-Pyramimonas_sp.AAC.1